jgi:hypothetical protein
MNGEAPTWGSERTHPLRCRCGNLQGVVSASFPALRAVCYCADCQAYARFLKAPGVLDRCGGTEVVATRAQQVRCTAGVESLACLSLRPRGLLRWYAGCCGTPIGNTPRNRRLAYVGLIHSCLGDEAARQSSFGAVRMVANGGSATCTVRSTPVGNAIGILMLASSLLASRLSGGYRRTPFFDAGSGAPVRTPYVLSEAERAKAYDRAS